MTTPHTYREHVAANVRSELGRKNMSGAALARSIKRDPSYVSRRLRGEQPWDVDDLDAISQALAVAVESLTKFRA